MDCCGVGSSLASPGAAGIELARAAVLSSDNVGVAVPGDATPYTHFCAGPPALRAMGLSSALMRSVAFGA